MRHPDTQFLDDILKRLYACLEQEQTATVDVLVESLGRSSAEVEVAVELLIRSGQVRKENGGYVLRLDGLSRARHLVRAHRLYETMLARNTSVDARLWHTLADKAEHGLSESDLARLERELGNPRFDPHGDPIPLVAGEVALRKGCPLVGCVAGWSGTISHVEDEPPHCYEKLCKYGLAAGMYLCVESVDNETMCVVVEGERLVLTRLEADLIQVAELLEGEKYEPEGLDRLHRLRPGERATLVRLTPALHGPQRQRLLDLGFVPQTSVEVSFRNASGDPVAYTLRHTKIALRHAQARHVVIRRETKER